MNILIIEDDVYLASRIRDVLIKNSLTNRIDITHSYLDFLNKIWSLDSYEVILIDIILWKQTDNTGLDILKIVRKKGIKIPVIMITGISSYDFLESAFSWGASDYIIKPFRLRELEIRINKWFQDYIFFIHHFSDKKISYKKLIYDLKQNKFFYKEKNIPLTKSSKYLFWLFVIYSEKLLTNDFLIGKIWGDNESDISSRNIRISVLRLKKKLKDFWIDTWIENIRGEGYIFRKITA